MITLAPLTAQDLPRVAALTPLPEQEQFSGTGAAIAADDSPGVTFHGIFKDGTLVGTFKIDSAYKDGESFAPGGWGLRSMLIDAAHQGRGLGRATFKALPDYLRTHYPDLTELWLTVNCRNPAAFRAYLSGGWEDTGSLYHGGAAGPQHIMRLALR